MNGRLGDLTISELRRILITTTLFVVVLALFLWMVRTVIIAAILAIVIALYLRPIYGWMRERIGQRTAALLSLALFILPVLGLLTYAYAEIAGVARYTATHQQEIASRIDASLRRIPFLASIDTKETVERWVTIASNSGLAIPGMVREALTDFSVAATIFAFTVFYILVDAAKISAYLRSKVPPRYDELTRALEANARGVLYGAIYSTFLTQAIKSAIIFAMMLVWRVPLAPVLAILSFIIGFFPIVGSWSIYMPVAAWLLVFRDAPVAAGLMITIGFFVNTVYISTFLRPKIAAEKSAVLNFFWMFVGLVTGVYTFGLPGILLGPILIGLLKAIIDTVTAQTSWAMVEADDERDGDDEVTARV
ncbi:MAG TPA: AI-2E family transporter [Gemmatimonadaceae bacterium]|nr:AI-2E family transporter [Gemmatimonadaceae bacterium]